MYNSLICKIKKKCSPFCIIKYSLKNILFVKRNYLQPALLTLKFLLRRALFSYVPFPHANAKRNKYVTCVLKISIHIVLLTAMKFPKSFTFRLLTRALFYTAQRPLTSVCCVNDCKCFNFIALMKIIYYKRIFAIFDFPTE